MKITQLKQQVKNPERASIFVDGKYSFSLTLDQVLQEKLKKDVALDQSRLKQLQKLSEEGKLRARTLEWLLRRPHSSKELRDYLYKKNVEKDLIKKMVLEFTDNKYLNDVEFARWFAENRIRKNKSTREITAELNAKGINREIIASILEDSESADEKKRIKELVTKLRSRSRYKDEDKLILYLQRKGFKWSDIKEVVKEL